MTGTAVWWGLLVSHAPVWSFRRPVTLPLALRSSQSSSLRRIRSGRCGFFGKRMIQDQGRIFVDSPWWSRATVW